MKIAVVDLIFNWPPDGGARVDVKEVWSRIAQIHDVMLFVPQLDDLLPRGKILTDPGFAFRRLPIAKRQFNRFFLPHLIRKAVDEFKPDLVFIADGYFLKPWVADALKSYPYFVRFFAYETLCLRNNGIFMCGLRSCYRSHTGNLFLDYPFCNACALKYLVRQALIKESFMLREYLGATAFLPTYPQMVRNMIRNAQRIIVYNRLLHDLLMAWNPNITIAPGGINLEFFPVQETPPHSSIRIGMSGRLLDYNKGFHVLRRAYINLLDRGYDLELWLTGKPFPFFSKIPSIQYKGWFDQRNLKDFYSQVDICVTPSIWQEPFGIVAVEAMASGKPVVATRVGGLQSIIQHGKTGFLVDSKSSDQIADALEILINDPVLRKKMGEEGAREAREKYSWPHVVDSIYLPLLEQPIRKS